MNSADIGFPNACVGGRGSEYIVWVVARQTFTASNKKFCQAFLLLSFLDGMWHDENSRRGKDLGKYPYTKQMLLLCPEPS